MTNEEILEKAIQKAIDGGWYVKGGKLTEMHLVPNAGKGIWSQIYTWQREDENTLGTGLQIVGGLYDFIFNHDFAKALWGEEESAEVITRWHRQSNTKDDYIGDLVPEWEKHLQQMVISDDPIKYLGENI